MLRRHLREVLLQLILAYFPFLNYKPLLFKKAKASCTTNDLHLQFRRFLCCFLMTCHCEKKRAFVKLVIGFGLRRFDFHGSAREAFFMYFTSFSFSLHDSLIYVHCHPIVVYCFNLRDSKIGESFSTARTVLCSSTARH